MLCFYFRLFLYDLRHLCVVSIGSDLTVSDSRVSTCVFLFHLFYFSFLHGEKFAVVYLLALPKPVSPCVRLDEFGGLVVWFVGVGLVVGCLFWFFPWVFVFVVLLGVGVD